MLTYDFSNKAWRYTSDWLTKWRRVPFLGNRSWRRVTAPESQRVPPVLVHCKPNLVACQVSLKPNRNIYFMSRRIHFTFQNKVYESMVTHVPVPAFPSLPSEDPSETSKTSSRTAKFLRSQVVCSRHAPAIWEHDSTSCECEMRD